MKDPRQITPAEFQIMEALWSGPEERSVREVWKVVLRDRKVAYTTVMTLLGKLAEKGSVARSRRGKAYFYKAAVGRGETLDFLLREFVDVYLGGDWKRLSARIGPARPTAAATRPAVADPTELDVALL